MDKIKRTNKFMSLDIVKKVVTEAAEYGPTGYSLHMFGEPLMHPQWQETVKIIKKANRFNVIHLTTNGELLDTDVCKAIEASAIDKVFVSMTFFDWGLKLRIKQAKKIFKKTKLVARTYNNENIRGITMEKRQLHNFSDKLNSWSEIKVASKRYPCWKLWYTLAVTSDGDITLCCADYQMGLMMGNIKNRSLENIWGCEMVKSIHKEHREGKFNLSEIPCKDCDAWNVRPNIFLK